MTFGENIFLSPTYDKADCIPQDDIFEVVDNLSTLEIVNLLTIGPENLKSQEYL